MTLRKVSGALALILCLAFAGGCGRKPPGEGPGPVEPPSRPEPPKKVVGVLLPLSGTHKDEGEALLAGLKLALRKKGVPVGLDEGCLEVRDYGDSVTDSLGLARDLIEVQKVPVMLGPSDPRGVEMVEELARQRKVAVLTPVAAPMKLSEVRPVVWRLTCTDEEEGRVMAAFALKKLFRTVAIIVDSRGEASERRAAAFSRHFTESGGHVLTQLSYAGGDTSFRRLVRMAAEKRPDLFYLPGGRPEAAAIIEEMKQQKVVGSVVGSSDWDTGTRFPSEVGPGWAVFAPCRFHAGRSSLVTAAFVTDFQTEAKVAPGAAAALGYDAGLIILDAFSRARGADGSTVSEIADVKLLAGATGRLAARKWGLAADLTVLRLKGQDFVFETDVVVE